MDHEYLEQVKKDLEKLLKDLYEKNMEGVPIVVEGDNDITALKLLGFEGTLIRVNQGKPLFNVVEEWAKQYDEMIILTDWDRTGGRLARILSEAFDANCLKYDLEFRKKLAQLTKKDIKDVQGLPKFMDNLEVKIASRTRDPAWDEKSPSKGDKRG